MKKGGKKDISEKRGRAIVAKTCVTSGEWLYERWRGGSGETKKAAMHRLLNTEIVKEMKPTVSRMWGRAVCANAKINIGWTLKGTDHINEGPTWGEGAERARDLPKKKAGAFTCGRRGPSRRFAGRGPKGKRNDCGSWDWPLKFEGDENRGITVGGDESGKKGNNWEGKKCKGRGNNGNKKIICDLANKASRITK